LITHILKFYVTSIFFSKMFIFWIFQCYQTLALNIELTLVQTSNVVGPIWSIHTLNYFSGKGMLIKLQNKKCPHLELALTPNVDMSR
jgi:hypothetical protein